MTRLTPFHNVYRSTAAEPESVPDLVLLHGWGMHSIVWDDVMPGLLAHFRVTVVDLPGMGQSPLPNAPYTLDFLAEKIHEVMPEKAHLIGWSLGGLVAMQLAQRYPGQVQSVVTVATTPRFVSAPDWPAAMKPEILQKFAEVFEEDHEGTLIRFLALNCKGSTSMRDDVRKMKEVLYFCGLPAPRALREGLLILANTDMRTQLAGLSLPLMMLFGEHDNLVPAAVMADVEKLNPAVTLAMIKDVAHVPFLSAPDVFIQAVTDFYREQGIAG